MTTIFVVEDDTDTRETLALLLSEQGFGVRTAADGRTALSDLLDCPADVVLLDLVLPHMNGWELLDAMRRVPSLATIPVIATSALTPLPELPRTAELLCKPFDLDRLLRMIHRALRTAAADAPMPEWSRPPERTAPLAPASGVFKTPWPRPGLAKSSSGSLGAPLERASSAARARPPIRT